MVKDLTALADEVQEEQVEDQVDDQFQMEEELQEEEQLEEQQLEEGKVQEEQPTEDKEEFNQQVLAGLAALKDTLAQKAEGKVEEEVEEEPPTLPPGELPGLNVDASKLNNLTAQLGEDGLRELSTLLNDVAKATYEAARKDVEGAYQRMVADVPTAIDRRLSTREQYQQVADEWKSQNIHLFTQGVTNDAEGAKRLNAIRTIVNGVINQHPERRNTVDGYRENLEDAKKIVEEAFPFLSEKGAAGKGVRTEKRVPGQFAGRQTGKNQPPAKTSAEAQDVAELDEYFSNRLLI